MELPASLMRIMEQRKDHSTNSNSTNYKCSKCRDTGWIQTDTGFSRCECYETDYLNRLWENFGVNPMDVKKLNDYKPYNDLTKRAKEKTYEYITNFNDLEEEKWLCLMGQPGGGKTHLVLAVGKALLEQKIKVVYMPYLEATRELKSNAMDDEYYNKLSNRYKRAEVLIIDDLFKDKVKKGRLAGEITPADMNHIYPIINFRYSNKLLTLISTECTPNMLLDLDEALAGRILEMCGKRFGNVFNNECNYRLRQFMS
ncbi:ATP-binding protein [Clostridium sp. CTA-5]